MHEFEFLYFTGCPSWQTGLDNLQQAIVAENLPFPVRLIEITHPQQAQAEHFLGSPSFRIDGIDFWPETRDQYHMSCRLYQTDEGMRGSPSVEMLRMRIREILDRVE